TACENTSPQFCGKSLVLRGPSTALASLLDANFAQDDRVFQIRSPLTRFVRKNRCSRTDTIPPVLARDPPMSAMLKTIFHVDMDAFFVSVEELFDPSLKGKAVVVGGQRHERGVVSAASYEARKFGVHSAMPLRTAAKLCPQAIFGNGHPDRYRACSEKAHKVLTSFSPQVEMVSIDEAYLDMTGTERLHGPPLLAAHKLHLRMKQETALNCSIGIGSSRLIAKVCSGKAKPHGILYVVPGQEA